ncbi:MAG: peptidoglycan DD-metalloendopeptidase family protein [Rhodospirillum sp.]|nr:peptidoglycan DD-metalloendopeptidase family protein [Rhodospirillum sp.]MCF8491330.1 peptidoglycan DD-metalloendopeptidase family protein [Rhodospirillum sp.]MCF8503144.1 peptidoglycan DD-metalloendopeptidase family protein [Rhodospirillum sp.]
MSDFDPQELSLSHFHRRLRRYFPERYLMIRSDGAMRQMTLTSLHQIAALVVAVVFFGWVTYATAALIWMDDIVSAKNERIEDAREAYKSLLAEVSVYKQKVAEVTNALQSNHSQFAKLVGEEGDSVAPEERSLAEGLSGGEDADFLQEQRRYDREQQILMTQLTTLQQGMEDLSQARVLLTDFDGIELEMRKVVLQRDLALSQNQELSTRVKGLEDQLQNMEEAQVMLVERFGEMAQDKIAALEIDLSETGLDVDNLIKRKKAENASFGQGGPFLPLELPDINDSTFETSLGDLNDRLDRWGALHNLVMDLPLAGPLNVSYRVTSRFGVRKDPVNGRLSRHEGLDMGAPMLSPILATAPGKVVYAGWRERYGRVVEVDHGMGLTTRYAHMRSIKAQLGQEVGRGDEIGSVGSSGRSTGSHLHYEVRVNGKPRNPAVFMKAGKNVFEGK